LKANRAREREQPNGAVPSPRAGIIFDRKGERLPPSHAVKVGKRYRYCISHAVVTDKARPNGIRLSTLEIGTAVADAMLGLLTNSIKPQLRICGMIASRAANSLVPFQYPHCKQRRTKPLWEQNHHS
jgi:hypothetical protein